MVRPIAGNPNPVYILGSDNNSVNLNLYKNAAYNVLATMDYAHDRIHAGIAFSSTDYIDIASGATYTILFDIPDGVVIHIEYEFMSEMETSIIIYEGTTVSDNGTLMFTPNKNRLSANPHYANMYYTPTVVSTGTALYRYKLGSGHKAGGANKSFYELAMRPGKSLFYISNDSSSDSWISWNIVWFETGMIIV